MIYHTQTQLPALSGQKATWIVKSGSNTYARGSEESITSIDAAAGKVNITLHTGTVQPSCQWEIVR